MKSNKGMLHAVFSVMADSKWRALFEIHALLDGQSSEAAISARLREFRREPYCFKFNVERVDRRLREGSTRLYEYRVVLRDKQIKLIA